MNPEQRVIQVVADELGDDVKSITPNQRLVEDLGMDSLDAISLVIALEEEFEVEIPDRDVKKLLTVKDIVDYFETRLSWEHAR